MPKNRLRIAQDKMDVLSHMFKLQKWWTEKKLFYREIGKIEKKWW